MAFPRDIRRKLAALRPDASSAEPEPEAARLEDRPPEPESAAPRPETPNPEPATRSGLSSRTRDRLKARLAAQTAPPVLPAPSGVAEPAADADGARRGTVLEGPPVVLEELLAGEVRATASGVCYLMRPPLATACDWAEAVAEQLGRLPADRHLPPEGEVVFLDIETTGFSGLPVFLVGMLCLAEGRVSLTQILARDYPEEAGLLHETASALSRCSVLLTYNGATFDLPYLRDRAVYHAVDFVIDAKHTDLLPLARRRFRGRFADCKLGTLERHLCGRDRGDDIPASEIPERYREFVRSGDARLLEPIIRHNRLDLLTLAELLPHCLADD